MILEYIVTGIEMMLLDDTTSQVGAFGGADGAGGGRCCPGASCMF